MNAPVSRFERGLRLALALALALAFAHAVYRALHLGVEYFDGYDYLRNARALVGDPLLEYQPLRPPSSRSCRSPRWRSSRASPPADPIRLIAPHLTGALVSILSAGGVLWLFSRSFGTTLALLGTLLFVSTRYFVHYAPHVMADLPSAGWAAATLALYLQGPGAAQPRRFCAVRARAGLQRTHQIPALRARVRPCCSRSCGWLRLARRIDWRCARGVRDRGRAGRRAVSYRPASC